jgi:hypothetical protein
MLGTAALAFATTPASATVYVNKRVCGGDTFATCAAVWLDVTGGTNVTFRIFNLSGNTAASYGKVTNAGTIFNGIGFYNVPASIDAITSTISMSGPYRANTNPGGKWVLKNNSSVGFVMDFAANSSNSQTPFDNGIASGCAQASQLPTNSPTASLFETPCVDPNSVPFSSWVTFTFQVNQAWNASNVGIMFRGINTQKFWNPQHTVLTNTTECWDSNTTALQSSTRTFAPTCFTVTPEPMTMTLLATGLVGLGGMGYLRRRRAARQ